MTESGRPQLFTNGTVWMGADSPDQCALLVVDGRVAAVGDDAEAAAGEDAERIDLAGGFLMPSFGEGHAHPIFGGLEDCGPRIRQCTSVDEIIAEVRRYAKENPEKEWILGASYDGSFAEGGLFDARWLDDAVSDRPVVLRAWDYHTVWCNSKALEMAGIDADTPEPELGEIPRRADGSPLGVLREWGAIDLVNAVNPGHDFEDRVDALKRASEHFASLGVTWVQDAWVESDDIDVYLAAANRGLLSTRFNLALLADPRHFPASLPDMVQARARVEAVGSAHLTAHSVKFFADGVVENETGALLEPYCSGMHDHGMLVWSPEHLAESVQAVDAAGFQAHIHAIGDAAVRTALDAIEHAASVNGPSVNRPAIAHVQLAAPADLARFAELGVVPVMQPLWAQLDALMTVLTVPRLGPERTEQQYRMRTLVDSGATLSFGSDWPCSSAAPLDGISVGVSRMTVDGEPSGGWTADERLEVAAALTAYTAGVATLALADRTSEGWGQITPGASADLVWLSADPRTRPALDIPGIRVQATYLAGSCTYLATAHSKEHA
ncbi:amidohydrolase [Homoserinimonas sp. OAct 916]|uniref:amidohydrolase n=1 Tax=Homoserinimonas sp. OAct 916 TaxID=2211450 RepID=UPI001E5C8663|nr:amidohydrolase [Homoserinimonas sp. OAct 916]